MIGRRELLGQVGGAGALAVLGFPPPDATPRPGEILPAWRPGLLDIHHLATGRGDATVVVAPDGAVALIDAGAVAQPDPALVPARPDATRSPGAWIARYVQRRLRETRRSGLHAAMVTHIHPDHVGQVTPEMRPGAEGYRRTGISEVAAQVAIGTLLDPDWPAYGYPRFEDAASAENYVAFARAHAAAGGRIERLRVGASGQLLPDLPEFTARIVAARGRVWTGTDDAARDIFPAHGTLPAGDAPTENASASALLLRYGRFRYFAGSDLTDWADAGMRPWMNALLPAARTAGRVHVATLAHHGMFDASSAATLQALAARDWVCSAWHAAHPSIDVLERVLNPRLFPGPRDVYATAIHPAADLAMRRLVARLASTNGHIICRVADSGRSYRMIVTDSRNEEDRVVLTSGVRSLAQS